VLADSVTLARIFGEHARAGCKRPALLVKVVALREKWQVRSEPGLPIDARLGSSSVGTQLLFSHGQQTGRRLSLMGIGSTPIFELRPCGPVCDPLPAVGGEVVGPTSPRDSALFPSLREPTIEWLTRAQGVRHTAIPMVRLASSRMPAV